MNYIEEAEQRTSNAIRNAANKQYLTIQEVSLVTRWSISSLRKFCSTGELKYIQKNGFRGKLLFTQKSVQNLMESR